MVITRSHMIDKSFSLKYAADLPVFYSTTVQPEVALAHTASPRSLTSDQSHVRHLR